MKERPILFKPPMVEAIFAGEKTQTRRVVKRLDPSGLLPGLVIPLCPYGVVGDRLWVRETWSIAEKKFDPEVSIVRYKSMWVSEPPGGRWRPSIHMPRAACQLLLEITEVRIERLHDITEEDAKAEGTEIDYGAEMYRSAFKHLWMTINGAQSWFDNPWVWVVHFKRIPLNSST